jgi:tetratricopeptide (TPR) repeat protein
MDKNLDLQSFPLPLPPSLESYNELFMREPHEAIKRLEAQFRKREFDPICAVLIAWFYYEIGDHKIAGEYSLKAKLCSPGSPFLMYSPYYLDHPLKFEATIPQDVYEGELPGFFVDRTLSLDELIDKLSSGESSKIVMQDGSSHVQLQTDLNPTENTHEEVFATETLARIYESQGELKKAAQVYEILIGSKPEKAEEYSLKIASLKATQI